MTLNNLNAGEKAIVISNSDERMMELGITAGVEVELECGNDLVVISVRGCKICMRRSALADVEVILHKET